jgi:hypothetical protein
MRKILQLPDKLWFKYLFLYVISYIIPVVLFLFVKKKRKGYILKNNGPNPPRVTPGPEPEENPFFIQRKVVGVGCVLGHRGHIRYDAMTYTYKILMKRCLKITQLNRKLKHYLFPNMFYSRALLFALVASIMLAIGSSFSMRPSMAVRSSRMILKVHLF